MRYVVHHRYKDAGMCGEVLNLPYGTELTCGEDGRIRTMDGKEICYATSENAKIHFSRDDDGEGLRRGQMTHAIAYDSRERHGADGRLQRFTDEELDVLHRDYERWLRQDVSTVIFNQDFFDADVAEIEVLFNYLKGA